MNRSSSEPPDVPRLALLIPSNPLNVQFLAPSGVLREPESTQNAASSVTNASDTAGTSTTTCERTSATGTVLPKASTNKIWWKSPQETDQSEQAQARPVQDSTYRPQHDTKYDWLPATLHLPYLVALFAFSFAFGILALTLTVYSHIHTGLGSDDGTAIVFFGWRFAPTVVAVIYGVLVGTLLQDIRRTEVFARLSKASPASASSTLLFPLRAWWNDIFDGLSKSKNNGSRSWTLVLASAVNVLSLLVISPLSAAFLAPEDVELAQKTSFTRLNIDSLREVRTDNADALMFRTISGGLLNGSTSAWIKNSHFISPFWPDRLQAPPLTSSFALDSQKWVGETSIYRASLDCSPLSVVDVSTTSAYKLVPELAQNDTGVDWALRGLQLQSSDGCTIDIFALDPDEYSESIWARGGGWWVRNVSTISADPFEDAGIYMSNSSGSCGDRTFIFANTGRNSSKVVNTTGALCTTQYSEASLPVTVLANPNATTITFDLEEFGRQQKIMEGSRASNITDHIGNGFFAVEWSQKFQSTDEATNLPIYLGPLCAVTAGPAYEYNAQKVVDDPGVRDQALELYQQWFGQMFLSGIESSLPLISGTSFQAQILNRRTRIVAVFAVGLIIGILLLLSSFSILLVMLLSRSGHRPLNLNYEPANIAVMASIIASSTGTQNLFDGSDRQNADVIKSRLDNRHFNLTNGTLTAKSLPTTNSSLDAEPMEKSGRFASLRLVNLFRKEKASSKPKDINPTPVVFRTWMGPLLVVVMLGILAALIALYELSITKRLSSNLLTYELKFTVADKASKVAPYSIAPVVIAVALKLWYGAVDETLRRHQVFYEMTRQPVPLRRSLLTEYANTPLFLTSIKAVSNRHWILFLVGLGATAAELFTIGMSALWNRQIVPVVHSVEMSQQLELRAVPAIYERHWEQTSYGTYINSWLYSATIELSQKAATLPWTSESWSFIPTDFVASNEVLLAADAKTAAASYNIITDTTAIRARLQCEGVKEISDTSHWVTKLDLYNQTVDPETNKTQWDNTTRPPGLTVAYQLHPVIDYSSDTNYGGVPILSTGNIPTCCANITDGIPGESIIGYWSNNVIEGDSNTSPSEYNFFATWIVGTPLEDIYIDSSQDSNGPHDTWVDSHWLWTEVPRGQAISCRPIIEQTNATVTVDSATGTVLDYSLKSIPVTADSAWSDRSLARSDDYANITVSYGYLFWNALLGASAVRSSVAADAQATALPQNDNDHAFNFRDRGLNVDFMTYAMLGLVDNDKYALLDVSKMIETANTVFGTFFKHYASTSVNFTAGGRVYQPIGLRLPSNLSDPFTSEIGYINTDAVDAPRTRTVQIHVPHEMLVMSPVAEFLCIGVLVFLLATVVIVYVFHRHTFRVLPRDPDTLANIIAFVYGSSRLLEWSDLRRQTGDWKLKDVSKSYDSRLDVFADKSGMERWGIEIGDARHGVSVLNGGKDHEAARNIDQPAERVVTSVATHDEITGMNADGLDMTVDTQTGSPIVMPEDEQNTGISPIDPHTTDWTQTLSNVSRRRSSSSVSELSQDSDNGRIQRQSLLS